MREVANLTGRTGLMRDPGTRTGRRAARFVVAAAFLAGALLAAGGCASDGPVRPESPGLDRSEIVPSGVSEMRESLAAQRSGTLDAMDTARPEAADAPTGGPGVFDTVLDAVGWAAGRTLDVLSLQAFGLW
jgi:hypothetical protein